jgi:lysophospholipase L1-like esterase
VVPAPTGRRLRCFAIAAAVTTAVVVVAACSTGARPSARAAGTTEGPSTTYEPVTGRVVIVGDSLTVGAQDNLDKLAHKHGFTLDLSAQNGRQIPAGVSELKRLSAPSADLVVVALGTNDANQPDFDAKTADALIDQALATTGSTVPVLWVNVYRDQGTPAGDQATLFNRRLEAATTRHPNLTVLDWRSFVAGSPDIVSDDRIHLTTDGYIARSRWIRDAIVARLGDHPLAGLNGVLTPSGTAAPASPPNGASTSG